MTRSHSIVLAAALAAACAARSGAVGTDSTPTPPQAASAPNAPASKDEPAPAATRAGEQQEETPPLRGARGTPVDAGAREDPCPAGLVLERLREITRGCRKPDQELCGKVRLVRGRRPTDVSVTFDLASSHGAETFTKCVARRVKEIAWQCAIQEPSIDFDLGCKL